MAKDIKNDIAVLSFLKASNTLASKCFIVSLQKLYLPLIKYLSYQTQFHCLFCLLYMGFNISCGAL